MNDVSELSLQLSKDFLRQRERFYHAESLRNFARDNVPDGTFDRLQKEILHGVIDVCECSYEDGLDRMKATVIQAAKLQIFQHHQIRLQLLFRYKINKVFAINLLTKINYFGFP